MKRPEQVQLSREDGEALRTRLAGDALTADDRHVLDQVLQWYFWLLFALQEATFSLKRLRVLLFGEKPNTRKTSPPPGASSDVGGGPGGTGSAPAHAVADAMQATEAGMPSSAGERRPGHGRQGAETYRGAEHVVCRHETLAIGERCPVCGRGRWYRVAPGVDIRLEGYQAMVGVPVPDATQWDQIEQVADCAYTVFEQLKHLAAQGEVIYQDDTHVRILSLMAENRHAQAEGTN